MKVSQHWLVVIMQYATLCAWCVHVFVAAEEATEEATETKDEAEEQSPSRKVVRQRILVTYNTNCVVLITFVCIHSVLVFFVYYVD